jgi:hypothetical protein
MANQVRPLNGNGPWQQQDLGTSGFVGVFSRSANGLGLPKSQDNVDAVRFNIIMLVLPHVDALLPRDKMLAAYNTVHVTPLRDRWNRFQQAVAREGLTRREKSIIYQALNNVIHRW